MTAAIRPSRQQERVTPQSLAIRPPHVVPSVIVAPQGIVGQTFLEPGMGSGQTQQGYLDILPRRQAPGTSFVEYPMAPPNCQNFQQMPPLPERQMHMIIPPHMPPHVHFSQQPPAVYVIPHAANSPKQQTNTDHYTPYAFPFSSLPTGHWFGWWSPKNAKKEEGSSSHGSSYVSGSDVDATTGYTYGTYESSPVVKTNEAQPKNPQKKVMGKGGRTAVTISVSSPGSEGQTNDITSITSSEERAQKVLPTARHGPFSKSQRNTLLKQRAQKDPGQSPMGDKHPQGDQQKNKYQIQVEFNAPDKGLPLSSEIVSKHAASFDRSTSKVPHHPSSLIDPFRTFETPYALPPGVPYSGEGTPYLPQKTPPIENTPRHAGMTSPQESAPQYAGMTNPLESTPHHANRAIPFEGTPQSYERVNPLKSTQIPVGRIAPESIPYSARMANPLPIAPQFEERTVLQKSSPIPPDVGPEGLREAIMPEPSRSITSSSSETDEGVATLMPDQVRVGKVAMADPTVTVIQNRTLFTEHEVEVAGRVYKEVKELSDQRSLDGEILRSVLVHTRAINLDTILQTTAVIISGNKVAAVTESTFPREDRDQFELDWTANYMPNVTHHMAPFEDAN